LADLKIDELDKDINMNLLSQGKFQYLFDS